MASDISGVSSSGSIPPALTGPIGPVSPSRAVVPVSPATARPETGRGAGSPLQRSGVGLLDLLETTDQIASRSAVAPGELEMGLERARASLVRQMPGEALAALDGVWERAQRTEEGWFLRSGALTVLGLPGEGDRVAAEGLRTAPASLALRFGQSIARLALGDIAGARQLLGAALAQRPQEPLLMVQHAITLARQGQVAAAEAELKPLFKRLPDHPAVQYGRTALRTIAADTARVSSRETTGTVSPSDLASFAAFSDAPVALDDEASAAGFAGQAAEGGAAFEQADAPPAGDTRKSADTPASVNAAADTDEPTVLPFARPASAEGDVAEHALRRLGTLWGRPAAASGLPASSMDVLREARMLMRSFSAGGALSGTSAPEQSHAARVVLTALAGALTGGDGIDRGAPLPRLLEAVIPLLRNGEFADAERLIRRAGARLPDGQRRLLLALAQSEDVALPGSLSGRASSFGDAGGPAPVVRGEADQGPIVPLRLGLSLLEETSGTRAERWRQDAAWEAAAGVPAGLAAPRHDAFVPSLQHTGYGMPVVRDVDLASSWGAARAAADMQPATAGDGAGVRAVALLCVAIAAVAALNGYGVVAIACGAGAAWLGLRRSGRGNGSDQPGTLPDRDQSVPRRD